MRKIFSVLLVLMLFVGLFSLNVMAQDSDMRVALVLSGFLGDQSFNDSSYEGLKRAQEEYGFELKVLESGVSSEWEQNLIAMASAGYDLVVANTTQFQQIVENNAPMFPNTKFALIDGVVDQPNVVSAIFAQNEGSFLAGAAAAMFTQHDEIEGVNEDKIIGWVGGMDIPVLHDFLVGYKQGAKHIDPETQVLVSFAGTFNDPIKGKELTLSQYDQGADIVMNVASGTGNGILEAANETPHYAVGVDMDQDGIYPGAILTSMLKRMDQATYMIAKSVAEGNYEGGTTIEMNLSNGGVSLTDMSVMREALGDKFPEEILTRVQDLTEKVKNGEIEVDSYEGFQRN